MSEKEREGILGLGALISVASQSSCSFPPPEVSNLQVLHIVKEEKEALP